MLDGHPSKQPSSHQSTNRDDSAVSGQRLKHA